MLKVRFTLILSLLSILSIAGCIVDTRKWMPDEVRVGTEVGQARGLSADSAHTLGTDEHMSKSVGVEFIWKFGQVRREDFVTEMSALRNTLTRLSLQAKDTTDTTIHTHITPPSFPGGEHPTDEPTSDGNIGLMKAAGQWPWYIWMMLPLVLLAASVGIYAWRKPRK